MKIVHFDTLPSTNQYCELLDLNEVEEFTVYWADAQTAGIGQRGNHWHSAPRQNLTFSLILKPTALAAADQYQLTKALSLGIHDWLSAIVPETEKIKIKWPNDIYYDDKKICGTLISSRLKGTNLHTAIAGIGLNINQTQFPDWVSNPTSLRLISGRTYNLDRCLTDLVHNIAHRYERLLRATDSPDSDYLSHLFRLSLPSRYRYQGQTITATILGVNRYGHLLLRCDTGLEITCQLKEIQTLL